MKYITLLSLAFVLSSCFHTGMDDDYTFIDPKIKPYVDQFVFEAKERGIDIDTEYLKIGFSDLDAAGTTYHRTKIIVIDSTKGNWQSTPEELIFHELGHLYLQREHENKMMTKYFPLSLMSNISDANYESIGNSHKREYYINELFGTAQSEPFWLHELDYLEGE